LSNPHTPCSPRRMERPEGAGNPFETIKFFPVLPIKGSGNPGFGGIALLPGGNGK